MKHTLTSRLIAILFIFSVNSFVSAENDRATILWVMKYNGEFSLDSEGMMTLPFKKIQEKHYLDKQKTFIRINKKINESADYSKIIKDEALKKEWIAFHASLSKFKKFDDNWYKNPDFYSAFSQAMIETHSHDDLEKKFKKHNKEFVGFPLHSGFFHGAGILLRSSWMYQDNLTVTKGLVEAEMTWMLAHMRSIYYSGEQDSPYGFIGNSFIRGFICNPEELLKVVSNTKLLDMLPIEVVSYLPKVAKLALDKPIGERIGSFKTGKIVKNSPEIEKRRKIAKEKYLPQINKIIADYLKDKKADK